MSPFKLVHPGVMSRIRNSNNDFSSINSYNNYNQNDGVVVVGNGNEMVEYDNPSGK